MESFMDLFFPVHKRLMLQRMWNVWIEVFVFDLIYIKLNRIRLETPCTD